MPEDILQLGPVELLDPSTLPDPWRLVVFYWLFHHPHRTFLPVYEDPHQYRLSWDDLRDILVVAGVIENTLVPM